MTSSPTLRSTGEDEIVVRMIYGNGALQGVEPEEEDKKIA